MDERLKQYLRECKEKKLSWDQVQHVLLGSNYPVETVAEAKTWYETGGVAVPENVEVKSTEDIKKKKGIGVGGLIGFLVVLIFLVVGGSWGIEYMVATQRLTLPNAKLQNVAEKASLTIPGIPVNPKVLLAQVGEAHKKVSKASFEISISGQMQSSELESLLGSKSIDAQIKGYSDVTDPLNPKISLNLLVGKEIDLDLRKPDKVVYLKVNKLPVAVYAILGIDPLKIKPLWENWMGIDTSKPDTSARQKLDQQIATRKSQPEVAQDTQEILNKIMNEDILPSIIIGEENHNGVMTYKLSFKATPEQINKITRELAGNDRKMSVNPSEIVKALNMEAWIDKKTFLIGEMDITSAAEVDKNTVPSNLPLAPVMGITSEKQRADLAIVIKMSDFGKDMPITKPDKFLTPEEFLSEFMKLQPDGFLGAMMNPTKQFAQANNTKRMADINAILNAFYQYNADNKNSLNAKIPNLPIGISKKGVDLCSSLVPNYLAALPADPKISTQVIYDCKSAYDTGYVISREKSGKITINAPMAENGEVISVTR